MPVKKDGGGGGSSKRRDTIAGGFAKCHEDIYATDVQWN